MPTASVLGSGSLSNLAAIRGSRSRRASSWDRTGGNADRVSVPSGDTHVLVDTSGAGTVRHIWMTIACEEQYFLRRCVFRMYWDGADKPSVETPVGDFFGMGHAATRNFVSAPLQMSPQGGRAFNCFFPMPFAAGARIEFENQGELDVTALYYYVDYEELDEVPEAVGRFHAFWNRENPCDGIDYAEYDNSVHQGGGRNPSAEGNYLILDTSGAGHYVGCHLDIENLRETDDHNWYGEGDDMIFIDGEPFPPSLHGTGTEDFFSTAWCPDERYDSPYHGIILPGGDNWSGHITLYRYHIEDPVVFKESIKVTIEHGHANYRSDDYSSTAYWYQTEPRALSRPLPPVDQRLPRTPVDMSLQLS